VVEVASDDVGVVPCPADAAGSMMTVLVVVAVRPWLSVATKLMIAGQG